MIRRTKIYFTKANAGKLNQLNTLFQEASNVINLYIDVLWDKGDFSSKFVNFKVDTWLSARLQQALGKQALEIVKSQRKRYKQTKPIYKSNSLNLDGRFIRIELDKNSFDVWLTLSSIGNKVKIKLPARKHIHFNKFKNWDLKKSIRLIKDFKNRYYAELFFEKEQELKIDNGNYVSFDIGYKKLITSSANMFYGLDFKNVVDKISRKMQGSNAFKRALVERDNYINQHVNMIDMSDYSHAVVENIKSIFKNKHKEKKIRKIFMNKLQRWTYSKLLNRLRLRCEVDGVHWHVVDPAYTSQTCSKCGTVNTRSRRGETFKCTSCRYEVDADYNASLNILSKFLGTGVYSPCLTS